MKIEPFLGVSGAGTGFLPLNFCHVNHLMRKQIVHIILAFALLSLLLSASADAAVVTPKVVASDHTVVLKADGSVQTWGYNQFGQLGNGTTSIDDINIALPVTVAGLNGTVIDIAATNSQHTLALMADGSVKAWGYNGNGQLGDGTTTSSSVPVTVTGLNGSVIAITTGGGHSLALMADGSVKAWGANHQGQLGNGTQEYSPTPVPVYDLEGVVIALAAGNSHSVALMADGTVKAWGLNYQGQLGDGTTSSRTLPITVGSLGGTVTAISAGNMYTLALMADGTVKAWGDNWDGQLGTGKSVSNEIMSYGNDPYPTPVNVIGLNGTVTAISAGSYHALALMADGTLKAWGNNGSGALGNGTTITSGTPVTVTSLVGKVSAIAAGSSDSFALMADGSLKAWGFQFGDPPIEMMPAPGTVVGLTGTVTEVVAGGRHTVALMADGKIKAWGSNQHGQLGDGTFDSNYAPVTILGIDGVVTAVSAGGNHTVTLMANGTVKAWGCNQYGQLGSGTNTDSRTPITVVGLNGIVTSIATGADYTVVLMADGTIKAWGNNEYGQLGDGTTTNSNTPVAVTGLMGTAVAIAAGGGHTLALMADGSLKIWGQDSRLPLTVTGLNGTVTAFTDVLVLMTDGTVNILSGGSAAPVSGLNGTVKAISTNVILMTDGTVMRVYTANIKEQATNMGETAATISSGGGFLLTLQTDGTVKAWGLNSNGQLGNESWQLTPQQTQINLDNIAPVVNIDRPGGSYLGNVSINLSCSDNFSGCAGVHYTVDGSPPTLASPLISSTLHLSSVSNLQYFAADAAGNNSEVVSQSYTIIPVTYSLSIAFYGTSDGTVTVLPKPPAVDCSGSCNQYFEYGTVVTIAATANTSSIFSGWSGCDANDGNQCIVTMNSPRNLSVYFNTEIIAPIKAGRSYFGTIAASYGNITADAEISLMAQDFYEVLNFNRSVTFNLKGGYSSDFISATGFSIIHGLIIITGGAVSFDNIVIM